MPARSYRPTPPATPASNGFESIPTEGCCKAENMWTDWTALRAFNAFRKVRRWVPVCIPTKQLLAMLHSHSL